MNSHFEVHIAYGLVQVVLFDLVGLDVELGERLIRFVGISFYVAYDHLLGLRQSHMLRDVCEKVYRFRRRG